MVDDCSTDKSREIVDEYDSMYENFKAIHLPKSSGSAGTPRNIGITKATGEYLMFLDHDDYYAADACDILYNKIVEENVDVVLGSYINVFDDREQRIYGDFGDLTEIKVKTIHDDPRLLILAPSVWTKIYKRSFILDNKFQFKEKLPNEDLVFVLDTFMKADGIVYLKDYFSYYFRIRDSEGQESLSHSKTMENLTLMTKGYVEAYSILIDNGREEYFPILFNNHLQFWANNFLLSSLTVAEQRELLEKISFLFEKFRNYDTELPKYLIPLFSSIGTKDYDEAICIKESLEELLKTQKRLEKEIKYLKDQICASQKEHVKYLTTSGYLNKSKRISSRITAKIKR
jgi:glycosyltransferase involved in cell wall biosynthesis